MLKDAGIDVTFVGSQKGTATDWQDVCEGHGGFTIGPGPSLADKWTGGKGNLFVNLDSWLGSVKADYILLYVGVNDFCNIGDLQKDYHPAQQGAARLGALLDKIHELSPSTKIFYASISQRYASTYDDYNKALPDLAKSRDYATFVDMAHKAGFGDSDWDNTVVHPTASGDQKMAQVWFDSLKDVLNDPNNPPLK
jgi:lysophospholipase L1-like esterase